LRALVTGGAGFLGSHMVDYLRLKGYEVAVLDNFSSGFMENLAKANNVMIHKGDTCNYKVVEKCAKDCDKIFHFAAHHPNIVGHVVKHSVLSPKVDAINTIIGTLNVLEAAKTYSSSLVYASTAAVYGMSFELPSAKEPMIRPTSPYGVSKYAGELYCHQYFQHYGLPVYIARIFNSYGPRQRKYVMFDMLSRLKENNKKVELLGNGEEQRDFIFVSDTIQALYLLSETPNLKGRAIDIGTGNATRIKDVIMLMCNIIKVEPEVVFTKKSWAGDVVRLVSNPSSKLFALGWKPKYNLKEGLSLLIEWFENTYGKIVVDTSLLQTQSGSH